MHELLFRVLEYHVVLLVIPASAVVLLGNDVLLRCAPGVLVRVGDGQRELLQNAFGRCLAVEGVLGAGSGKAFVERVVVGKPQGVPFGFGNVVELIRVEERGCRGVLALQGRDGVPEVGVVKSVDVVVSQRRFGNEEVSVRLGLRVTARDEFVRGYEGKGVEFGADNAVAHYGIIYKASIYI